jgi:hypothetical protein
MAAALAKKISLIVASKDFFWEPSKKTGKKDNVILAKKDHYAKVRTYERKDHYSKSSKLLANP